MLLCSLLVPVSFFAEHAVRGFPEAAGCGAQGSGPPGQYIDREPGATSVAIATDGFFVISLAPRAYTLTVTDAEGELVDGAIRTYEGGEGWEASEPLAIGTTLTATVVNVDSANMLTDQVELRVVAEPQPVVATGLVFGEWFRYAEPIGDIVECTPPAGDSDSCDSGAVSAPVAVELVEAVEVSWSPPPGEPMFGLWDLTIEGEGLDNVRPGFSLAYSATRLTGFDWAWLKFEGERHCATLTVHDRRTGGTASHETCIEPEIPTNVRRSYDLARCDEPPSEAMTEEWCEAHPESTLAACTAEGEPSPNEPSAGPDGPSARRTSEGCSASGASPTSGGLLLLASLAAVALRRRQAPAAPRA